LYNVPKTRLLIALTSSLLIASRLDADAAADAVDGVAIFQRCFACHSPVIDINFAGPTLQDVFGQPADTIQARLRF